VEKRAKSQSCFRVGALTAALAAMLFVASGATLWHQDAPGSAATCPICYAAHLPALRSAPAAMTPTHSVVAWTIAPESWIAPPPPAALQPPPRAPPA
jgi:hypothetical protein